MEKGEEQSKAQWLSLFKQVQSLIEAAVKKGERSVVIPKELLPEYVVEQLATVNIKVNTVSVDLYGEYFEVSWPEQAEGETHEQ